jgi:L,D-transpeptidase ErfK/SrfK
MKKTFCHYIFILLSLCCLTFNAKSATYLLPAPGDDVIGHIFTIKVQEKDSLTKLMQHYEISYNELVEANPNVNFYALKIGQNIVIPTQYILPSFRQGIVINIPELRLYYFPKDGRSVYTYPVGLGRMNWRTPTTITKIIKKQYQPTWHVPESIKEYTYETQKKVLPDVVLPGPENPLGEYALYLEKKGYLIHGTNDPLSVGGFVSSGCIRLLDYSIEKLFQEVDIGTPVYIIHHVIKTGWLGNNFYLEVHSPIKNNDDEEEITELNHKDIDTAIKEATTERPANINLQSVTSVLKKHTGIPTQIGEQI